MFTGLIREVAKSKKEGSKLFIKAIYRPSIGDSIAVNGACLTVVKLKSDGFEVELSDESRSLLCDKNLNGKVHIEPAMRLSDRLEGHILQGHIDCKGEIEAIKSGSVGYDFFISMPKEFIRFVIPKGSIAIDGVSLTVNDVFEDSFRLTIIPHTMQNTIFDTYKKGRCLNIETDMFARYIYHLFRDKKELSWSDVDSIMARW